MLLIRNKKTLQIVKKVTQIQYIMHYLFYKTPKV